jgi:hypothetical protein
MLHLFCTIIFGTIISVSVGLGVAYVIMKGISALRGKVGPMTPRKTPPRQPSREIVSDHADEELLRALLAEEAVEDSLPPRYELYGADFRDCLSDRAEVSPEMMQLRAERMFPTPGGFHKVA